MERFEPLVKWMAIQRFPNDFHKVEDLTQEIIFKVHRACHKYDPTKSRAFSFVKIIARNHLIDSLRRDTVKKKVAPRSGPPIEECGSLVNHREKPPVVLVGQREQADRVIKKAENLLSQNQLEVIKGLYLEGKTLRELAKERKKPEGTVKSLLNRALRILRKHFNEVAD
jgi:RNA polymerase sigma-70 factor (ECF subfamily)